MTDKQIKNKITRSYFELVKKENNLLHFLRASHLMRIVTGNLALDIKNKKTTIDKKYTKFIEDYKESLNKLSSSEKTFKIFKMN